MTHSRGLATSHSAGDWARTYPGGDQEILNIVMAQAFPGAIVLMHLQVANTLAVLPTMIERLPVTRPMALLQSVRLPRRCGGCCAAT